MAELQGIVKLYRAVSLVELYDLRITQQFRAGANSVNGKFFAENISDAAKWGELLEGPAGYRIIEVELPGEIVDQLMRWEILDGIGAAFFAELNQLTNVTFREVEL